jgi:glycosyltransferase involved in cell wall biosynthesis
VTPEKTTPEESRPTISSPDISIVIPVFNEEGAAADLAREIARAFDGRRFEIVFVDDGSCDGTRAVLSALVPEIAELRVLYHQHNAGQSRAVRTGVLGARGAVVVTLDGDGQNDPADAPRLVDRLAAGGANLGLVGGRREKRQDSVAKRLGSLFGNGIRKQLLRDQADDTGCGLKVFRRESFLRLPYFDHMHRFLPALMLREGLEIAFEDVNHRPRTTGASKYNNLGRAWVSISDLMGVLWLRARARDPRSIGEV